MTRDKALELLAQHIANKNLLKHMLASEAVMRALAEKLGQEADEWGIVGLLHDLDFEQTKNEPSKHGLVTADLLKNEGLTTEQLTAIKTHNAENLNLTRKTDLDYALTAAEQLTGLIVAGALVQPDKKLSSLDLESLLKKFKQKSFAAGCSRDDIKYCEKLGLSLEIFLGLGLSAMQGISAILEL